MAVEAPMMSTGAQRQGAVPAISFCREERHCRRARKLAREKPACLSLHAVLLGSFFCFF